jgi:glutamate-1-semialdehyde 2,1-aminomutase
MTNNLHLVLPQPGWHRVLRELTRQHGTLLALDETTPTWSDPAARPRCGTCTLM